MQFRLLVVSTQKAPRESWCRQPRLRHVERLAPGAVEAVQAVAGAHHTEPSPLASSAHAVVGEAFERHVGRDELRGQPQQPPRRQTDPEVVVAVEEDRPRRARQHVLVGHARDDARVGSGERSRPPPSAATQMSPRRSRTSSQPLCGTRTSGAEAGLRVVRGPHDVADVGRPDHAARVLGEVLHEARFGIAHLRRAVPQREHAERRAEPDGAFGVLEHADHFAFAVDALHFSPANRARPPRPAAQMAPARSCINADTGPAGTPSDSV